MQNIIVFCNLIGDFKFEVTDKKCCSEHQTFLARLEGLGTRLEVEGKGKSQ